jgi:hypothetical protein
LAREVGIASGTRKQGILVVVWVAAARRRRYLESGRRHGLGDKGGERRGNEFEKQLSTQAHFLREHRRQTRGMVWKKTSSSMHTEFGSCRFGGGEAGSA